uniref:tRNA (Guanine(37)-N1)-methyltransferase n=1 Tax=Lygus hesperus TaxID=30085 RepID=A0A0A9XJ29_LYGHE
MEVIAGEAATVTHVREQNCIFELDFSKVYWNSRLQMEHCRMVHLCCMLSKYTDNANRFKKKYTSTIVDLFCGVGPFAIPSAKRGCFVYANDLNPTCIEYLKKNSVANHVERNIIPSVMDAREFWECIVGEEVYNIMHTEVSDNTQVVEHI